MKKECNEMPEWAKNLEDWGKRMDEKFSQKDKKEKKEKKAKPHKWEKRGEFFGDFVGNLIGLFIVNYAPNWFPGFFTESYSAVLAVFNVVIIVTAVIYLLLMAFSNKWFYLLSMAVVNALAIVSVTTMLAIFPFNVPYGMETLVRFGMIVATVIVGISVLVYFVRFILSLLELNQWGVK